MSKFDNLSKSIKKKMTLNSYKTESQQVDKTAKSKVKVTFYLEQDIYKMLNEMSAKKIIETGRQDKSSLVSQAIEMLYKTT